MVSRKRLSLFALLLLPLAMLLIPRVYHGYQLLFTDYGYWADWAKIYGFAIPKPKEVNAVYNTFGPTGEGTLYVICSYDDVDFAKSKVLELWNRMSSDTEYQMVNDHIVMFKTLLQGSDTLAKHPIELDRGSLYFLKKEQNGSWLLAILHPQEKEIHVMEVARHVFR